MSRSLLTRIAKLEEKLKSYDVEIVFFRTYPQGELIKINVKKNKTTIFRREPNEDEDQFLTRVEDLTNTQFKEQLEPFDQQKVLKQAQQNYFKG